MPEEDQVFFPELSEEQVNEIESGVRKIKSENKITGNIYFMPIIESALGVIKSYEIASASDNRQDLFGNYIRSEKRV